MTRGNRSARLLAAALCLAIPRASVAQRPDIGAGRITAQVSLGTLTIPVGFVAGGLLGRRIATSLGATATSASRTAAMTGAAGASLSSAAVVTAIGSSGPASGSYVAALGGALAGGLGSYALVELNRRGDYATRRCEAVCRVSFVAIALLPAAGAAFAFNSTRTLRQ